MAGMNCPKCGEECDRDEVDVGVGMIYGPYGCMCGWSESAEYDSSEGPSPAQLEHPDWIVDSQGGMVRKDAVKDKLETRFGLRVDL